MKRRQLLILHVAGRGKQLAKWHPVEDAFKRRAEDLIGTRAGSEERERQ